MDQVGRVISTNEGMARLEVKRVAGCGTNCKGCASSCEVKAEYIDLINTLDAKPGEFVEIVSDTGRVLKFMLVLYGVPLLFLIAGFLVGYQMFAGNPNQEIMSLGVGILALVISGFIIKLIDKNSKASSSSINAMSRKL